MSQKIRNARFAKMPQRYEQEQGENAKGIKALRLELKESEGKRMDIDTFLEAVRFQAVCILFPELDKLVPPLQMASVYALLSEFPGAKQVAATHLTRLKLLLGEASIGRFGRDRAMGDPGCRQMFHWLQYTCQVPGIAAHPLRRGVYVRAALSLQRGADIRWRRVGT